MLDELAMHGEQPVYTVTPAQAPNVLAVIQSEAVRKPKARIRDWTVDSAGCSLRLLTIHPPAAVDCSSAVMYFHGAGWVMGNWTTHDRLVRELAVAAHAAGRVP
ncbi:MAG TPA: alpha/beta hydrolase fold domain-containing protein [Terriglobales bacterium]